MVVEELATKLGLDVDALQFAKAILLTDGLKLSLQGIAGAAKQFASQLIGVVTDTAKYAGQMDDTSKRTGMNVEALQAMGFAAEQAGMSFGELTSAAKFLAMNAANAGKGGGESAEAFKRLGVRVKDSTGQLKPAETLLRELAPAFDKVKTSTEKTQLAMKLFGRSGQAMVPVLKGGEEGLAALMEEAHVLGVVMDEEGIKAGDGFGDQLAKLNAVLAALKRNIGAPLLKPLTSVLKTMTGLVSVMAKAVKANWHVYVERLKWAFLGLGTILLAYVLPGFIAKMAAMASTALWYAALTVASLLYGKTALAAALMPILGWLALAAVIALVGEDLYQFFTGGDSLIGRFLKGPWDRMQKAIWGFIDSTLDKWDAFWERFQTGAQEAVAKVRQELGPLLDVLKIAWQLSPAGMVSKLWSSTATSPQAAAAASVNSSSSSNSNQSFKATFQIQSTDPKAAAVEAETVFREAFASQLNDAKLGAVE